MIDELGLVPLPPGSMALANTLAGRGLELMGHILRFPEDRVCGHLTFYSDPAEGVRVDSADAIGTVIVPPGAFVSLMVDKGGAEYLASISPDRISGLYDLRFDDDQRVGDRALVDLSRFTSLRQLFLSGLGVTDVDLQHFSRLTSLQFLCLSCTSVTDDGIRHLAGLTSLQTLNLSYTDVTDDGLRHLAGLTSLQDPRVGGTRVTHDGLQRLYTAKVTRQFKDFLARAKAASDAEQAASGGPPD